MRKQGRADVSLLSRFAAGELDVLVGTQMIAKGHDFPRVTLVGVVSADVGLGLADFRAGERTFQLLTQVAGRAGRGERAGEAIVQTLYPEHYSVRLACRQDYAAFFEREIEFRQGLRYPPFVGAGQRRRARAARSTRRCGWRRIWRRPLAGWRKAGGLRGAGTGARAADAAAWRAPRADLPEGRRGARRCGRPCGRRWRRCPRCAAASVVDIDPLSVL